MTSEFNHYQGCKYQDPDNCSGCALITGGKDGPNYAAWPLAYMENGRVIPSKWKDAFKRELQSNNKPYADNVRNTASRYGAFFSDGSKYGKFGWFKG